MAETGSFAGAAARLHMTLSAVSMQMRALETELGAELFDRGFRPARLTPAGRAAIGRAREVLAACDRFAALADGDALTGEHRLGFILTASVRVLPAFLALAGKAAPGARFHAETGLSEDLARRVVQGDLDAAVITRADSDPTELVHDLLAEEEIVFALPPGCDLTPAEALAALPFLQFLPLTGIGRLVARGLERLGVTPARPIILDGIEAAVECTRRGVGMTALPEPDIRRYAGDALRLEPMGSPPIRRELSLVTRADGRMAARRARLASLMTEALG